jgi:hypothetical protein
MRTRKSLPNDGDYHTTFVPPVGRGRGLGKSESFGAMIKEMEHEPAMKGK